MNKHLDLSMLIQLKHIDENYDIEISSLFSHLNKSEWGNINFAVKLMSIL